MSMIHSNNSKTSIVIPPTLVDQPLFPVKQGSVLSRLLESTNVSSSRCPTLISAHLDNPDPVNDRWGKKPQPKSRIPTKCQPTVQGRAFEKSLRCYATSSPGTPTSNLSRTSSPTRIRTRSTSNSNRATNPNSGGSKIAGPNRDADTNQIYKRHQNCIGKVIQNNRPPISPRGYAQNDNDHPQSTTSIKSQISSYEPRPVRLAYGINGPQYKASQKIAADLANNNKHQKVCSGGGGGFIPGDRMTRKLVIDAENQRSNRMLHSQALGQVERRQTIETCSPPLKGENGSIICPRQYEEKACQTISTEILLFKKKKQSLDKACDQDDLQKTTTSVSQIQQTDIDLGNKCSQCDEIKARLHKRDGKCQRLQGTVNELKKALEDLSFRNEMLELQLFESKERFVENREDGKSKKGGHDNFKSCHEDAADLKVTTSTEEKESTAISQSQRTIDAGVETDKDIFQTQLKFSLETFLFSCDLTQFSNYHKEQGNIGGDSLKIGHDDVDNDEKDENNNSLRQKTTNHEKALKMTRIALAVRDALLNEIRIKLKKGYRILQQRCEPLILLEDSQSQLLPKYQDITPSEAGKAFHSYRRFVRFIHTYVERSLAEITEYDEKVFNLDPNDDDYLKVLIQMQRNKNNNNEVTAEDGENEGISPTVVVHSSSSLQADDQKKISEEIEKQNCDEKCGIHADKISESPNGPAELSLSQTSLVLFLRTENEEDMVDCGDKSQIETRKDNPSNTNHESTEVLDNIDSSTFTTLPVPLLSSPITLSESKTDNSEDKENMKTFNQRISVAEWLTTPSNHNTAAEESQGESSPLHAAKLWLERTPSPLTTFILNPISITKLFDPLYDPATLPNNSNACEMDVIMGNGNSDTLAGESSVLENSSEFHLISFLASNDGHNFLMENE